MSRYRALRSQITNLRAFRAFFPARRFVRDGLRLPLDHLLRGGLRPYPLVVDLNVTNRCNLACGFCYNQDNAVKKSQELSFDDLSRLVDEAARFDAGFFLSGGEPLLRDDLPALVERMTAKGLAVGLVTNGARLDRAAAERLIAAGCDAAVVSLHGTATVNDELVGRPGSFRKSMDGLRALAAAMRPPGPMINCVVNERSLPSLRAFLDEALTVRNCIVRIAHLSFATAREAETHERAWQERLGDLPSNYLTYRHEVRREVFRDLPALLDDRCFRHVQSRPVLSRDEVAAWYAPDFTIDRRCTFVAHSTIVNADGTVFPCQYYGTPMGNIREESLATIWHNDRYRRFRAAIRDGLLPGCARCCKL